MSGWLSKVLWAAALAMLGLLYLQSTQVNINHHLRVVQYMEQLHQKDAHLNQFVLQSRYGQLLNYDPLVATQRDMTELLALLAREKPHYFSDGESPIQRAFKAYREELARKFTLIEKFKSHNAVLRNSHRYFPLAVAEQLNRNVQSNLQLHRLLEQVLLFQNQPSPELRSDIESTLAALERAAHARAAQVPGFSQHATVILDYQPEVDGNLRDITQSATFDLGDQLFALYSADFAQRERLADHYKLALAAASALMLAYLAWAMTNLQRARRRLAQSLRELEFQKYALDQHSIVSITDRTGKILYTNEKFSEISQYPREELLGQDHRVLNSGHHPREFFKQMWATIGHGAVWHGEVKNRRRDGSFYWVDSTIVPFMDEQGKPERYVSIRSDITERKAADELMAEQRAFYERISETLGEGLYVQDAAGRCTYINAEAERLIGWSRDEFLGKPVHDTIHFQLPDGRALPGPVCPIMQDIRATGRSHRDDQIFTRKNGSHFPVGVSSQGIIRNGQLDGVVVAFQDITARKEAEQAMRHAKELAEQTAQTKSDFLANMSHEIRTPMNGIIGMTELALDTELSREQREYLALVQSSANALMTIINDILDFSKIEAGKLDIEIIEFSLESMLRDAMKALAIRAHQKGLELVLNVASQVPDRLLGDPGRLRQVILNLVGNAIKFTERGEIELAVQCVDSSDADRCALRFSVRDTGIGIAPEKFQTIFESFSQADTSTTRQYGGTGLGLTISAQLVALMGGRITLDSAVGRGSTFAFTLSMAVTDQLPLAAYQHSGRINGLPVLIADDNATNCALLCEMLTHWKMRPTAVGSGSDALVELQRAAALGQPYALAILDVQMPEMDGFTLAQQLQQRASSAGALVMMLTSQGQRGDAARCRDLGIRGYLTKPVSQSELLDAIMTALGEPLAQPAPLITRHTLRESHRPLQLLLAEDNAVNQTLAVRLLEKMGHRVTLAHHGAQAVDYWQQDLFDAILMDVDMPVMNGFEATQRIRELEQSRGGRTRIVAMTAHAMPGAREECLRHGMDGYLAKPLDSAALWRELEGINAAQAAVSASAALPAADFTKARQTMDDSRELFDEISALFLADAPAHMQQIRDAVAAGDADTVRHSAHALKGMVGIFAAERTLMAAQRVERDGLTAGAQALDELDAALAELQETIRNYDWNATMKTAG